MMRVTVQSQRKVNMPQKHWCPKPSQKAWTWVRSLARIKVSAFGAGDRGFKSHRARFLLDLAPRFLTSQKGAYFRRKIKIEIF